MLLASTFMAALLVLGVLKFSSGTHSGNISVAVFDVVKFANAQRAVASQFIGKRDEADEAGTLLLTLSKRTDAAIAKVAGAGTLVLVKQGVVAGGVVDITDDVLKELGLPTNVPTQDAMGYLKEVAPTMLFIPTRTPPSATANQAAPDTAAKVLP